MYTFANRLKKYSLLSLSLNIVLLSVLSLLSNNQLLLLVFSNLLALVGIMKIGNIIRNQHINYITIIKSNWKIIAFSLVPLLSGVQTAYRFNDRDSRILLGLSQELTKSEIVNYPPGLISIIFPIVKFVENSIIHNYLGVIIGILIIMQITIVYSVKVGRYNGTFLVLILSIFNFPLFNEWIYSFSSMQIGIIISSYLIFELINYQDKTHKPILPFYLLFASLSLSSPAYLTFLFIPLLVTILFSYGMSIFNNLKFVVTLIFGSASWILYRFVQNISFTPEVSELDRFKGAIPSLPIPNFSNNSSNFSNNLESIFAAAYFFPSLNKENLVPIVLVIILSLASYKYSQISIKPIALITFFMTLQYLFNLGEIYSFEGRVASVIIIFSHVLFVNLFYETRVYPKIKTITSGFHK